MNSFTLQDKKKKTIFVSSHKQNIPLLCVLLLFRLSFSLTQKCTAFFLFVCLLLILAFDMERKFRINDSLFFCSHTIPLLLGIHRRIEKCSDLIFNRVSNRDTQRVWTGASFDFCYFSLSFLQTCLINKQHKYCQHVINWLNCCVLCFDQILRLSVANEIYSVSLSMTMTKLRSLCEAKFALPRYHSLMWWSSALIWYRMQCARIRGDWPRWKKINIRFIWTVFDIGVDILKFNISYWVVAFYLDLLHLPHSNLYLNFKRQQLKIQRKKSNSWKWT